MKDGEKKLLLLVEDEVLIALNEKMSLEKYGYSVITVTNGGEAIETVKATPEIDLILMDIDLGNGADGTNIAEIILKEHEIPIVFLSSHTEPEIVAKTEKITSYGYVVKDSNITVLDTSIKMAFKLFSAKKEIHQQNMLIKAGNENLRFTIEELEKGRNRLTSIFRAAPTGIGVVIDRIIVDVNQRICEMTGYHKEEIIGKSAKLLYPTEDDYDFVGREKYQQIKLKGTGTVETRWKCKDGRIIDVLLSSTPLDTKDLGKGVTFTALDITDRKQVEDKLKESEEKFRSYVENAPDGIFVADENGRYIEVNKAACEITGYAKEELINFTIVELIQKEYHEQAENHFKTVVRDGFASAELGFITKSGDERFWNVDGVKLSETRFLGFTKDITTRKQAEKALRESEIRFLNLMDNIDTVAVQGYAKDGTTLYWNNASERLYGYSKQEAIGANLLDLIIPPEMKDDVSKAIHEMAESAQPRPSEELLLLHKNGSRIPVISNHAIVRGGEHDQELFCLDIDISELKKVEELVKQQLSEKEALLKEVHHRIKNNITSIEGLLSMQLQSISNPDAVSVLQDAVNRVQGMRILYDKLLLSKNYQEISIKDYTDSLIDAIMATFPESENITIEKQIKDFHMGAKEAISIGIIINELLTNAFKYAFKREDSGQILIALDKSENHVTLTIHDNGRGINERIDSNKKKGF